MVIEINGNFVFKKYHIPMVGSKDSGKLTILHGLIGGKWTEIPHISLANETAEYKRLIIDKMDINDLDYCENINGIIFVFDSSNNT